MTALIDATLARFALFGMLGFGVDVSVLYLGLLAGLDPYSARLLSFLAAAAFTWLCNRRYTFSPAAEPSVVEWLRYLGAMSLGGAVNYGSYAACIAASASCARVPALGVAIGSIAGLALNYLVSKHFVFRR